MDRIPRPAQTKPLEMLSSLKGIAVPGAGGDQEGEGSGSPEHELHPHLRDAGVHVPVHFRRELQHSRPEVDGVLTSRWREPPARDPVPGAGRHVLRLQLESAEPQSSSGPEEVEEARRKMAAIEAVKRGVTTGGRRVPWALSGRRGGWRNAGTPFGEGEEGGDRPDLHGRTHGRPLALEVLPGVLRPGRTPASVGFEEANAIFYESVRGADRPHAPTKTARAKTIDADIVISSRQTPGTSPTSPRGRWQTAARRPSRSPRCCCAASGGSSRTSRRRRSRRRRTGPCRVRETVLPGREQDWPGCRGCSSGRRGCSRRRTGSDHGKETTFPSRSRGARRSPAPASSTCPTAEIFTAPSRDLHRRKIFFEFPAIAGGREVAGIRLTFRKGRVVEASAEKNGGYLKRCSLPTAGASVLGEFGIGERGG